MGQETWKSTIEESPYSIEAFCKAFELNYHTVLKWLNGKSKPREKNLTKMEEAMKTINGKKRLDKHPSWGYATPEQVERIKNLGLCPERDQILKQIEKQNETYGKVYF